MINLDKCHFNIGNYYKYNLSNSNSIEIFTSAIESIYCFYSKDFVMSNEYCDISCRYGTDYPIPMVSIFVGNKGYSILCENFTNIRLIKSLNGCHIKIEFDSKNNEISINMHKPTLKSAITVYREIYNSKYNLIQNERLKNTYHVRRYFLHKDLNTSHLLKNDMICLEDYEKKENTVCGGVDVGLLFDISYDANRKIRCGNNNPINLNKKQLIELNQQLTNSKCIFFYYFDPLLIEYHSDWDIHREKFAIQNISDEIIHFWGNNTWAPDLNNKRFIDLSLEYCKKALSCLNVEGLYLDEIGCGYQYLLRQNPKLNSNSQLYTEKNFVTKFKSKIGNKFWMCEYAPADCMNYMFDIVLSDVRTLVNIYRFIFPELKFVRIIGCDYPLGDNVKDVNKSFFNGEALWLDGDIFDKTWYSKKLLGVIKKQYTALKENTEAFSSLDVTPLIKNNNKSILVNRFNATNSNYYIYTILNPTDRVQSISFDRLADYEIKNVYNANLKYMDDIVTFKLNTGDVACIRFNKIKKDWHD